MQLKKQTVYIPMPEKEFKGKDVRMVSLTGKDIFVKEVQGYFFTESELDEFKKSLKK